MHKAVIGLMFGDCGKGMFVNYLASRQPHALNVRFSGGHQCGHTAVANGVRHVFSNFGSGTLQGVPTYWMKTCTVCPIGLTNEMEVLRGKGVNPLISIHADCPVVTPMDREANRNAEEWRQHGSCGVGFGKTIQREEDHYSLRFIDIFYPDVLRARLKNIAAYYCSESGWPDQDLFLERCEEIRGNKDIRMAAGDFVPACDCIFEGSQGMLLDQNYGFFPNVTRSNTGSTNIAGFDGDTEWYLLTRAYQTRHGNGFMTNEGLPHNIRPGKFETNVTNKYQGAFRRSLLDVSLLEYAIARDAVVSGTPRRTLVITCMDHIENEYRFTHKGDIVCCSGKEEFARRVADILGIGNVITSSSEDGSRIEKLAG